MTRPLAVVLGFLLASAAHADTDRTGNEASFSLGAGLAYELAGINLAYRHGRFEGYLGIGALSMLPGISIGGRYFLHPDGSGFFLGLNSPRTTGWTG